MTDRLDIVIDAIMDALERDTTLTVFGSSRRAMAVEGQIDVTVLAKDILRALDQSEGKAVVAGVPVDSQPAEPVPPDQSQPASDEP